MRQAPRSGHPPPIHITNTLIQNHLILGNEHRPNMQANADASMPDTSAALLLNSLKLVDEDAVAQRFDKPHLH